MTTEQPGASPALSDQLGLPPGHADVCRAVNETPVIQSLLYDLNLLPEQTSRDPARWYYTITAVAHMKMAADRERERCAKVAESEDVAPGDDAIGVQQCIAASIRRA